MRHTLALLAAVCLFGVSSIAWVAAQQQRPASTTPTPTPTSIEEVLTAVRADMQADRADVMAKNLSLTVDGNILLATKR